MTEENSNDLGEEPGCRVVTREVLGIVIQTCDRPVTRIIPEFHGSTNVGLCRHHSHLLAELS